MKEKYENLTEIKNSIIKGDNLKELRKISDNSIDLIILDPGYVGDECKVKMLKMLAGECRRVLKETGNMWLIGNYYGLSVWKMMIDIGFDLCSLIAWNVIYPNELDYINEHREFSVDRVMPIFWYKKSYESKNDIYGDKIKSVWKIEITKGEERIKEACDEEGITQQLPDKLVENIMNICTKEGDVVLDPFFGTGTTGDAAFWMNRSFIGIESDEKYARIAKKRIIKSIKRREFYDKKLELFRTWEEFLEEELEEVTKDIEIESIFTFDIPKNEKIEESIYCDPSLSRDQAETSDFGYTGEELDDLIGRCSGKGVSGIIPEKM
jgi:DNA modification methylase